MDNRGTKALPGRAAVLGAHRAQDGQRIDEREHQLAQGQLHHPVGDEGLQHPWFTVRSEFPTG